MEFDVNDLTTRAAEARDLNRMRELVKGSGYHDDDKDWKGSPCCPQKRGLPRVSEHLIVFHGEFAQVFLGEDAVRALDELQAYRARLASLIQNSSTVGDLTGTQRKLLKLIPRLKLEGTGPVLVLPPGSWNDILEALYESGIGLTGLPLEGR